MLRSKQIMHWGGGKAHGGELAMKDWEVRIAPRGLQILR
jgi:hypothetical protein